MLKISRSEPIDVRLQNKVLRVSGFLLKKTAPIAPLISKKQLIQRRELGATP